MAAARGASRRSAAGPLRGDRAPAVRPLASNRRALHDYEILERLEAGVALTGTEVKAARMGRVQLKDGHVEIRDREAWLVGAHIGAYTHGHRDNHEPERPRKLLLKRREIEKWMGRSLVKGVTVIPLAVYLKGERVKIEIALAQGRKLYDKRQAERERELDREAAAAVGRRRPDAG